MSERCFNEADPERAWTLFLEDCLSLIQRAARRVAHGEEEAHNLVPDVLERLRADWPALLERYRASRSKAQAGFRVWLSVVVRNLAIDVWRSRHGRPMTPRPVARLAPWRRELWRLAVVEGRDLSDVHRELGRRGAFDGSLAQLAEALEEVRAAAPRPPRRRPSQRAVGGEPTGDEPELQAPGPPGDDPATRAVQRAAHEALGRNLARLDPDERFLLRLYFLEGATARDVARVLGFRDANQVYEEVKRLVRRLREGAGREGLGPEDLASLRDFDWAALGAVPPEEAG